MERSSTTPVLTCNGPKLEGAKTESNGAIEFTNEEFPSCKRGGTVQITTRSGNQKDRHCLDHGHGRDREDLILDLEGMESTGQG